jgi:acyl carrier protein
MNRGRIIAVVAKSVGELLETPPPAAASNFFELGGDSLAAAELALLLEERLELRVPIELIFDTESLLDLAVAIEAGFEQERTETAALAASDDATPIEAVRQAVP